MRANEANWDRVTRVALGVGLIAVGLLAVGGGWGWVVAAIGGVLLVTGFIGWCPIYAAIGRGTRSETRDDAPKV